MQSTASLIAPTAGVLAFHEGDCPNIAAITAEGDRPLQTWEEATFNKSEAKRKRKTPMHRTSAGEDSNSQEDFPILENESPQQKSLRTRRLNRFRSRRAKELTNNRKALKKLPYVIHIDGTGKGRGIHKRQWRAAVRGQCGRLDPTMDNINHHPKHVVDSIWHALQKEWEFVGFSHRAREMFEKVATKFMRNRKMQLKYKSRKSSGRIKPDDVNDIYWKKIVNLTKDSSKQNLSAASSSGKGKEKVNEAVKNKEETTLPFRKQVGCSAMEQVTMFKSPDMKDSEVKEVDSNFAKETGNAPDRRTGSPQLCPSNWNSNGGEDVESRIRILLMELESLQHSRKSPCSVEEIAGKGRLVSDGKGKVFRRMEIDSNSMKENVKHNHGRGYEKLQVFSRTQASQLSKDRQFSISMPTKNTVVTPFQEVSGDVNIDRATDNDKSMEMECGDLVPVFAVIGGKKEQIGDGIVMGLAGSKFARKVIPNGWRSIKILSHTTDGASEVCPIPAGWKEQVKEETVAQAEGRIIVWPQSLLSK